MAVPSSISARSINLLLHFENAMRCLLDANSMCNPSLLSTNATRVSCGRQGFGRCRRPRPASRQFRATANDTQFSRNKRFFNGLRARAGSPCHLARASKMIIEHLRSHRLGASGPEAPPWRASPLRPLHAMANRLRWAKQKPYPSHENSRRTIIFYILAVIRWT